MADTYDEGLGIFIEVNDPIGKAIENSLRGKKLKKVEDLWIVKMFVWIMKSRGYKVTVGEPREYI